MLRSSLRALALLAAAGASMVPAWSETITLGHTNNMIFLPSYVAVSKGYFKDEGLDSEIKFFRGGPQAMAAVISGDLHIYVGVPTTAMQAVAKGQDVKVFATTMDKLSTEVVMQGDVAKEKGITSASSASARIQALKGLTIGVNAAGGSPDQVLRFMLNTEGLNAEKDVTIAPVGDPPSVLAAFGRKRIDVLLQAPPTSDLAVEKFGGVRILSFLKGDYEPLNGITYLALISRSDWLTANHERSVKVVRAIWRAEKLIHERPAEAMEAVRTYFSALDIETFESAFKSNQAAIPTSPRVEARGMEISKRFHETFSGEKFDIDVTKVFTNEYVDAASKRMR